MLHRERAGILLAKGKHLYSMPIPPFEDEFNDVANSPFMRIKRLTHRHPLTGSNLNNGPLIVLGAVSACKVAPIDWPHCTEPIALPFLCLKCPHSTKKACRGVRRALAYNLRGILPARNAARPPSTPNFIARAVKTDFCAAAIAVFISTPSPQHRNRRIRSGTYPCIHQNKPSHFPESTEYCRLRMPSLDPMVPPKAITATEPIFLQSFAINGSLVYTITLNPFFQNFCRH